MAHRHTGRPGADPRRGNRRGRDGLRPRTCSSGRTRGIMSTIASGSPRTPGRSRSGSRATVREIPLLTRYYGWYANRMRGMRRRALGADGERAPPVEVAAPARANSVPSRFPRRPACGDRWRAQRFHRAPAARHRGRRNASGTRERPSSRLRPATCPYAHCSAPVRRRCRHQD
jgi:hypothetical protein